jgi:pimeloyl-ACP methyl ester carboxylesterase
MPVTSPFAAKLAAIPSRRAQIVVDGVSTAYWNYGPADGPISLVLVHGFRGDHHGLEPFVAELGGDLRIIVPDVPGFGLSSDVPGAQGIAAYASWLRAFCSEVGTSRQTVVLGHSFGSIVVSAALAGGLDVSHAILVNPIAANALHGPRGILTKLAVFYYKLSAVLPEKLGFALLKNPGIVRIMSVAMAKTKDPDLRAWIHDQHDQYFSHFSTRRGVLEAFETSVSSDVSTYADSIHQEVLMIVAELDDITALPEQRVLAARLAHAQLKVIPSVGHLVHYEAPALAAGYIRAFVEQGQATA